MKKFFHKYSTRSKKLSMFAVNCLLLWVVIYCMMIIRWERLGRILAKSYYEINCVFVFIGVIISAISIYELLVFKNRDSGYYDRVLIIIAGIIGIIVILLSIFAIQTGINYLLFRDI